MQDTIFTEYEDPDDAEQIDISKLDKMKTYKAQHNGRMTPADRSRAEHMRDGAVTKQEIQIDGLGEDSPLNKTKEIDQSFNELIR